MITLEIDEETAKELGGFLQAHDIGVRSQKLFEEVYTPLYMLLYTPNDGHTFTPWEKFYKQYRFKKRVDKAALEG